MIYERISLDESNSNIYLDVYAADPVGDFKRNALLVLPGGGYKEICADREGEPVAMAFMPYGYNAFVLHYSVDGETFPTQLIQASKAVKYIKDHAEKYHIQKENLFAVGFSAGGHLAASLGTMWHKPEIYAALEMPYGYNKPKGVMLIYPCITAFDADATGTCINTLLGKETTTEAERSLCCIDKNVDERSVPAFIVHTATDEIVSVKHSLLLAEAYTDCKIPYEMHIYPDAPHGVSIGNRITECGCRKYNNPHIAKWVGEAAEWAEMLND